MQFVLNKLGFNSYSFASNQAKAQQYSPFAKHIKDIENKRSKLFPDRMRVPGRKTKYIVSIVYLIHLYSLMRVIQAKKIYVLKSDQQDKLQRKSMPFFQSVQDVQYTILKHRWDLLTKQVLGEDFLKKGNFHNPSIGWQDMTKQYYQWARSGQLRYVVSPITKLGQTFVHGFSTPSI